MKTTWVLVLALVGAVALALLPRFLSEPREEEMTGEMKEADVIESVIVTDYCPTLEGIRKIADLYTTTDGISVDVDQIYDPLENLRAEIGCSFGAVRYPRHFEEYERVRFPEPDENLEFVIIRARRAEGGIPDVYALIDIDEDESEQEVAAETKADLEPPALKASFGLTAGM